MDSIFNPDFGNPTDSCWSSGMFVMNPGNCFQLEKLIKKILDCAGLQSIQLETYSL